MSKIRFKNKRRIVLSAVAAGALLVIGGLFIGRSDRPKDVIPSKSPKESASESSKTNAPTAPSDSPSGNTATAGTDKTSGGSGSLAAPWGAFVSNHHPPPNQEQSVCNTTPGASCYIQFSKDGVSKKLEARTADANGAVYWSWDTDKAGLSAGSWKISAVATLNGQTKSTDDPIMLEVGS